MLIYSLIASSSGLPLTQQIELALQNIEGEKISGMLFTSYLWQPQFTYYGENKMQGSFKANPELMLLWQGRFLKRLGLSLAPGLESNSQLKIGVFVING